jgi:carbon storage regulator
MLVVSRKKGEKLLIGNNIELTVVAVRGTHVRLGFTAPQDVVIQRDELRKPADELPAPRKWKHLFLEGKP